MTISVVFGDNDDHAQWSAACNFTFTSSSDRLAWCSDDVSFSASGTFWILFVDWLYDHRNRWVRLQARHLLLVLCSHHSSKTKAPYTLPVNTARMYGPYLMGSAYRALRHGTDRQTDRRIDSSFAWCPQLWWKRHNKLVRQYHISDRLPADRRRCFEALIRFEIDIWNKYHVFCTVRISLHTPVLLWSVL